MGSGDPDGKRKTLEQRQADVDAPGGLKQQLVELLPEVEKVSKQWHLSEYKVTEVSVVVLGHRYRIVGGRLYAEVVYSVALYSEFPIPHAGSGFSILLTDKSRFTFVQLANSVFTNSYITMGQGIGTDPPTPP